MSERITGKKTAGYQNYLKAVPKHTRVPGPEHPKTPRITRQCSKRSWDGQIRAWRRALHRWDEPQETQSHDLQAQQTVEQTETLQNESS